MHIWNPNPSDRLVSRITANGVWSERRGGEIGLACHFPPDLMCQSDPRSPSDSTLFFSFYAPRFLWIFYSVFLTQSSYLSSLCSVPIPTFWRVRTTAAHLHPERSHVMPPVMSCLLVSFRDKQSDSLSEQEERRDPCKNMERRMSEATAVSINIDVVI